MKLKHYVIFSVIMSIAVNTNAEILPKPQTTGGKPLMEMIQERRSSRNLKDNQEITKQDISNMLWAAWGITHEGKRTIATAMNRQELEVFIVTPTGISKYNPENNALTLVNAGDFRQYTALQDFAKSAPLNIVYVADCNKQENAMYQRYAAGAASQNVYLYCAQAGLQTVVRAGYDRDKLPQAMKLGDNEKILYVQTVGK